MQRFIRSLLTALILVMAFPPLITLALNNFWDVQPAYKHAIAINALAEQAIISGYPNGAFKPESAINRAEATKILIEANFPNQVIAQALEDHRQKNHWYVNFSDVLTTDWFGSYVEIAYQNNILQGYPDKTFKPANVINFAEALKIILNTYNADVHSAPFESSEFLYVEADDWFAPYFNYARAKNLINPDKFYHPAQEITRGEFAEIIYRTQEMQTKALAFFPINNSPSPASTEYRVTIPRLNLVNQSVSFANPYDAEGALRLLRQFPFGHYLAAPGSGKKSVLFGHSSGYAWDQSPYKVVLRDIDELETGDKIYINYQEKGYVYEIYKTEIIPETLDQSIVDNESSNELAIYTCWPPDSTQNRYVIYSKPL